MTDQIKRHETQWAEMSPDIYDGPKCDKVKPRWKTAAEGDRGSDDFETVLHIAARTFPPGTRISIQEPLCPKCDELREPVFPIPKRGPLYAGPCRCGFDWDAWRDAEYS
jgi:hypothetical protein